ncbi:hypothetical protein Q1695_005540 [Nippostrongylus brasiliensis]|nr:hypothetical protein Q1695_005540 [Nippostrongylus brasiliensis]
MNREDIDKVAASTCIIFLSGMVLFQSCHRASTIYFFELQTTTVIFLEPIPAFLIPFVLSLLLWLIYKSTKRSHAIEQERKAIQDKAKELEALSSPASRKSSRNESRKASIAEDAQANRLNRLLSDIQEHDTIHSQASQSSDGRRMSDVNETGPAESEEDRKPAGASPQPTTSSTTDSPGEPSPFVTNKTRFTCTKVDEPKLIFPDNDIAWRSMSISQKRSRNSLDVTDPYRKFSALSAPGGSMASPSYSSRSLGASRKTSMGEGIVARAYAGADDPDEEDSERQRNAIYKEIGQTNFFTYSLSALNLLPKNQPGLPVLKLKFSDISSEFFALHLPIWGCVVAFYIVLLELFGVHFAYYFYYHEETMVYSAFFFSIVFGLFHEFAGGWFTNDILAFSSIYIACSRIQAVSYKAATILLVGMAIFDIFWLYVIDLLSTVLRESRAPLFILIPRDHRGNKQSLAAVDIIIPGIFLNVIQKYSSMYDPDLFSYTYAAVFGALTVTMIFATWRRKITPALVLPAIMAIVVSLGLCTHRNDLWRFMIKYKRLPPPKRV